RCRAHPPARCGRDLVRAGSRRAVYHLSAAVVTSKERRGGHFQGSTMPMSPPPIAGFFAPVAAAGFGRRGAVGFFGGATGSSLIDSLGWLPSTRTDWET